MERALNGRGCTGGLEVDRNTGHQNPPFNSLIAKEPETFIKKKTNTGRAESSVLIETKTSVIF